MTDFISVKTLGSLVSLLRRTSKDRDDQLAAISRTFGPPDHTASYYVEPDCQHHNPADWDESNLFASSIRMPVFAFLNHFLQLPGSERDGRHQMFILGDAGMGKTSLLVLLRLAHLKRFWPSKIDCILMKLGSDTISKLQTVEDPGNTIVLLDALDEDPQSFGRVDVRVHEILNATLPFRKVILTCRTQYFPKGDKAPFDNIGRVRVGSFVCPTAFLSWFDDSKVLLYLKKRFPGQDAKIEESRRLIAKMGSLRMRPLLLSYIEEILESKISNQPSAFSIYEGLTKSWLLREERKSIAFGKRLDSDAMLRACIQLAAWMQSKGERFILPDRFSEFSDRLPSFRELEQLDVGGRSLLNKTSDGAFRFSHYSVQEFLVVYGIYTGTLFPIDTQFRDSDLTLQFLREAGTTEKNFSSFCFSGCKFESFDFTGSNFSGTILDNAIFKNCRFDKASLRGCSARFSDFTGSSFESADISRSLMIHANFESANLKNCIVTRSQLQDMRLRNVTGKWVYAD